MDEKELKRYNPKTLQAVDRKLDKRNYSETELQVDRQSHERSAIRGDVYRAAAVAFDLNPDTTYLWSAYPDRRIKGVSEGDFMKVKDALLRMRVMIDPRAQELFPGIAAEIPKDRQGWLETMKELSSRVPLRQQRK